MNYEQFEQLLDEDLAWRKKELSSLIFVAKSNDEEVILKSIILLLYAHYEGFIKKSSKLYIKYVVEQKVRLKDLSGNFKAVALKSNISQCLVTAEYLTLANEISFIERYIKLEEKHFKIKIDPNKDSQKDVINTEANLRPKVFKSILSILGLSYKKAIETRENYINVHLLANRNLISHGSKVQKEAEGFSLTLNDIQKLKDFVFSIIDSFRDELLDYIKEEYYLNSKGELKRAYDTAKESELEKALEKLESA